MNKEEKVLNIFEKISENYDSANDRISLGMQMGWKKHLISAVKTAKPEKVLDVCCGTGDISLMLSAEGINVTGLDFSPAMLTVAKEKDKENKVNWIQGNAMELPFEDGSFDACTISFGLRNTPDFEQVLREMKRVSRGNIYILDSFIPENKIVYPFYKLYFKTLTPLIGGANKYKAEYQWLFESTDAFLSPSQLSDLLKKVGFAKVYTEKYNFGTCCLLTAYRESF